MSEHVSENLYTIAAKAPVRAKQQADMDAHIAAGGEVRVYEPGCRAGAEVDELPQAQGGKRLEYQRRAVLAAKRGKSAIRGCV